MKADAAERARARALHMPVAFMTVLAHSPASAVLGAAALASSSALDTVSVNRQHHECGHP